MSKSKTFYRQCRNVEFDTEAPAAEETLDNVVCIAENSSVFGCALKVVIVAELFITGDTEFQTAGAMMLNALNWKLILVAG